MLQLPENKRDLYGKNKLNHSATVFHTDLLHREFKYSMKLKQVKQER